jgi:hypothetical protein
LPISCSRPASDSLGKACAVEVRTIGGITAVETKYYKVRHFEDNLHIYSRRYFSEQLTLFDEMMELYMEPLDDIAGGWQSREEKSPEIILLARMFNDFESTKLLLLYGLPEQAMMTMRDIIECMMLFRLFGKDAKLALRWMRNLKEYHPSNVKKRLDELRVDCPEYVYYGMLSELAHANLLSVVSRVTETKLTDHLIIQTYHFGGMNNPTWIGLVFKNLLILSFMTLVSVLPPAYFPVMSNREEWWGKVTGLKDRLVGLGAGLQFEEDETIGKDKVETDKIRKKLRLVRVETSLFDKEAIASDRGFSDTVP